MTEINVIKLVACFPILCGQILGCIMIKSGVDVYQESKTFKVKVDGITTVLRGILTFLGLGLLCLLVDILVTVALLIKNCLGKCC